MDENTRLKMARALLGQGMAGNAADDSKIHPLYQQHVVDAQLNGQPAMSYEQFRQQYQAQQGAQ